MGVSHQVLDRASAIRSFDVADFPVPLGREEEWRFTPLARVKPLLDDAPSAGRISRVVDAPDGVTATAIDHATAVARTVAVPIDRPSVLAVRHAPVPLLVNVPADTQLSAPVVVRITGPDAAAVVWDHVLLDVGERSIATVVVLHTGAAQYSGNVSVHVADGARLKLVLVQAWDDDAVHVGHVGAVLGRDAGFESVTVTLGGHTVRLAQTVRYDGPGAEAELVGLSFADADQHLEHRLFVDHSQPHCRSQVTYKNALQGVGAHTVWVGDVLIRAAAVGTQTYEINRNLLLTDGPRADSVPNLEIETGDVAGAGHASATGRFDENQLFYLMARGISEAEARRLVVRGFFAEVSARIGVPEVEAMLDRALDHELERTLA
jgi:Fe-S cluster assembly protein SufD